ncbi:MAG: RNA helicase [Desulfobacterales bacterium CG23_combo_of_CG06-09_8_20_14_all_52_9]|nr:MAG: RNA helicase [Desulfobacterales bacterium CG23_combo_of_CG06-09_8_20_14_all_52_9]
MARLEELKRGATIKGILPDGFITVVDVSWIGSVAIELTYKDSKGKLANELIYRDREGDLEILESGKPWRFDGDSDLFRLVSEAHRIRLAYLFDPLLAVHTSLVDPLPHQITAVYESMLPRQPLRFLLADDPGAGKTIMTGLLIKELIARGDLQRCLIVCPGNLVEQWQDELYRRFHLPFEIMTNDKYEAARTGNWFAENPLSICRLDTLSRNDDVQEKLKTTDWDVVVCDEAHKMSASFWGGEIRRTKRYQLGQLLSTLTRHFLLLTATPHNGKEEDFQLFMALLDGDRFEGKFRDGVHSVDASDLMRRMIKEDLLKFDGRPLFPERKAYTVEYELSDGEADLYQRVTEYVREEFNRAEQLANDGRRGTVGFALTVLQRRLASSPEAIYQSLRRRKERLEKRCREEELLKRGAEVRIEWQRDIPALSEDDLEDLEDAPDEEVENTEERVVDLASAAQTIMELKAEIEILKELEQIALRVRQSHADRKWDELSRILQNQTEMFDAHGYRRKLIIFTEHRDTLYYLQDRIGSLIGKPEAVVIIHGGLGREERKKAETLFTQDKETEVLIATDAAGEGINLQRAHLMVNYDLPWNPNRLEQRFGRIHRIGQIEVCHCWNLVAGKTREGDVYRRLLEKLEEERKALGGKVFNVLGKLLFDDKPLRSLLMEAIRYGDRPDVRARLNQIVDSALDRNRLRDLIEEHALAHDAMDASRVQEIREDMERADARRLQPHFVAAFFNEAFKRLGGTAREREPKRYEATHVPAVIRNRDRIIGMRDPVLTKYERISFEKDLINVPGKPMAEFICPGHPLLDATLDLILERHRDLLKQGAILIDESDMGEEVRALVYLEHSIQDARTDRGGNRRVVSRQIQFAEVTETGNVRGAGYAPYLDYRPPAESEALLIRQMEQPGWIANEIESRALGYAVQYLVPTHLQEVKSRKEALVDKTMAAVKERLTTEINYWDHRAEQLKQQELAGRVNARINSARARLRADELTMRLQKRMEDLQQERRISPLPPNVIGGAMIVPIGLFHKLIGSSATPPIQAKETIRVEMIAMRAVIEMEQQLGFDPRDVAADKCGYDVESRHPNGGARLRFIEVKGRVQGADTITVTKNEILTALNKPDQFILAIVQVDGEQAADITYVREPFGREPDFGVTSVNYRLSELLAKGGPPR